MCDILLIDETPQLSTVSEGYWAVLDNKVYNERK